MVSGRLEYTDEVLDDLAISLREWVRDNRRKDRFALLSDWCFENDFNPDYFSRFSKRHEEFRSAYRLAKYWQEQMVVKGALKGEFAPRFSQFFLSCIHKWKEAQAKQDVQQGLKNDFEAFNSFMQGGPSIAQYVCDTDYAEGEENEDDE